MADQDTRSTTLQMLRERRERIIRELASLEPVPAEAGGLTAREWLTWRTRLAELDSRIAQYGSENPSP